MLQKIKLKDYNLFMDGSIEVDPSIVRSLILKSIPIEKIFVNQIDDEIQKFNLVSTKKIKIKESLDDISTDWTLPEEYKYKDIEEFLINLSDKIENDSLYEKRIQRLVKEIELYKKHNLFDVLRVIIYVIDNFKEKNIVWGVGRGSSCSSYILYLIGLHDIDCVLYDIEIEDFLR
jgi:DNA polymerase III alpha subunit